MSSIEIPFESTKKLSNDRSTIYETVYHALKWYKKENTSFENIIILQPTNPFRKVKFIQEGIDFYLKKPQEFSWDKLGLASSS